MPPVLLVSMPFGPLASPSLGLSLLQAGLKRKGIEAPIRYFGLDFVRRLGAGDYRAIVRRRFNQDLLGEWVFAEALQGQPLDQEAYFREIYLGGNPDHAKSLRTRVRDSEGLWIRIQAMREEAGPFLEACVENILAAEPALVGFTSVFEQTAASLALAKRLKARRPELVIAFGGANAESPMGEALFEAYPFLDVVVSGEAEHSFPEAVARWSEEGRFPKFPGYSIRPSLRGEPVEQSLQEAPLDELPVPDFTDFLDQAMGLDIGEIRLPFEASRGCWWGAKQHCTFCGLNGQSMAFRSKSAGRVLEELRDLVRRHPGHPVSLVDNILDMAYFKTLLPTMAEEGPHLELFCEVKANLTKAQLRLMKSAGFAHIQTGIESLSDQVLALMRKGLRGLQSLQLLKWSAEVGPTPMWNILFGFPGEDPGEYDRMAAWVPRLSHLKPPDICLRIRLDRYSPNFDEAASRGIVDVRPYPAYRAVFGLPDSLLSRMAYFFAFDYADGRDPVAYAGPLLEAVEAWQEASGQASLLMVDRGESLWVLDSRPGAAAPLHVLGGLEAWVLRACDGMRVLDRLALEAQARFPGEGFPEALASLEAKGLILVDAGAALGLPLLAATEASSPLESLRTAEGVA